MYQLIIGNKVYSSWSLRPWLLMKTLDIPFEEINVELYTDAGKQAIRNYHSAGKVPLLIDTEIDKTLWDSMAIFEYLAETHPEKHLWPKDKIARLQARCVANEMHSSFFDIRNQLPMNCRANIAFSPINQALQDDINRVCAIWQECREQYAHQGDFLFGEFTISDAMFAPVVLRFKGYQIPVSDTVKSYMDTLLALPAMQAWIQAGKADSTFVESYERILKR